MAQYARELPVDKNNNPYTVSSPNFQSLQATTGTPTTSSIISLTDRTTVVEVTAIGGPIMMKWGNTSIATGNAAVIDNAIPPNTSRTFVVPQSVFAVSSNQSVMGANGANGLFNMLSVKTLGASSIATVIVTEF